MIELFVVFNSVKNRIIEVGKEIEKSYLISILSPVCI